MSDIVQAELECRRAWEAPRSYLLDNLAHGFVLGLAFAGGFFAWLY